MSAALLVKLHVMASCETAWRFSCPLRTSNGMGGDGFL